MDMEKNAVCRAIDYTGRNVIVTGGASGAGVGIAHRFAEAGANVAITYHSNGAAAAEKVEALRAFYQQQLYQTNLQTAVMDYLLQNSTFGDIPKSVLDYQVTQCLNYYYTMGGHYGYELDAFVQMMGYDNADAMLAALADNIESYAKEALVYQAVAEAMELAPTQEQIDAYSAYTDTYGANYCTMVAMMDTVTEALTTGAKVA